MYIDKSEEILSSKMQECSQLLFYLVCIINPYDFKNNLADAAD